MAYDVLFQISWLGGTPSEVVPIAEKHYNNLSQKYEVLELTAKNKEFKEGLELLSKQPSEESIQVLKDTHCCQNYYRGTKGMVWSWSTVGNHTSTSRIIKDLTPFLCDLHSKKVLDRVIVLSERESTETVEICQIRWIHNEMKVDAFKNDNWFWGVY